MSISLERADLLQLEPISNRRTLKLLPLGKKNKQKLLIGDDSGQLSCYEFKKGEPQIVFQLKVFDGPISCVTLGGNPLKRDKIFVSCGQRIVGVSKKGKEFFKLTSSLTENIHSIAVEDTRIWTACEYIYNLYDNGKDSGYFTSNGLINDLVVTHLTRDNDFDVVFACQDKYIRIVHVSTLFLEIPTNYPVTALAHLELDGSLVNRRPGYLVYGTSKGTLGLVQVLGARSYEYLWEVEDDDKRSAINTIHLYDINKDEVPEVVIGRDDGRVEIYKLQSENILMEPSKIFSRDIGQSIRSVEVGVVGTQDYPEIVVAAYSGKVISFTTEPIKTRAQEDTYGRSIQTVNNENRIKSLRKEVDDIRKKVEKEREKLKKVNSTNSASSNFIKPPPDFPVNAKFELDPSLAAYVLSIELQMAIDFIIIRSPVVLDLIETDTGSSVLSVTPPHLQVSASGADDTAGKYVAVFRCQSQERRISLTLRTNEGEFGEMNLTIVAASNPKAAKIIKYELKPLSLHSKVHNLTAEEAARPLHSIQYTGNLNMSTLHEWVQSLFPDVPPNIEENAVEQKYFFRNSFTGSISICEFRKNEIIISSESASTIAITKENFTRLVNYRRITMQENVSPNDGSVSVFLDLIREKLLYQLSLSRKMELVDAIQEIAMQEQDSSWLSEEYASILRDQETIRKAFKNRDRSLEYLTGIITDLYVDWNRIQGVDNKHKIPDLQRVIFEGNFNQIVKFFIAENHK